GTERFKFRKGFHAAAEQPAEQLPVGFALLQSKSLTECPDRASMGIGRTDPLGPLPVEVHEVPEPAALLIQGVEKKGEIDAVESFNPYGIGSLHPAKLCGKKQR